MLYLAISALGFLLSFVLSTVWGIQLPKPKGPFEIGVTYVQLTDTSRLDPFAPTKQHRTVQLSIHYPTVKDSSEPFSIYLPFLTANDTAARFALPSDTFQNISTNAHLDAPILEYAKHIVMFSPGLGNSRLFYATFAQGLASEGYVVVSVDHPYDASIVELSDGRVIMGNISDSSEDVLRALNVRVADTHFVVNKLATGNHVSIPGLHQALDTSCVGFLGHSLGGATAATAMVVDDRFVGGVNMDGAFHGTDVLRGVSKPFLIMGREGHNRTTDSTWSAVWPELRGFRREMEIERTTHGTFTDAPALTALLDLKLGDTFGTIPAERFQAIQESYLSAFFDFALRGKKPKLLDGPSRKFPEVTFDS
jgi:dienelactone hydrolase